MKFHIIDVEQWTRKPYYEHYRSNKCTFSITVDIDITRLLYSLKANGFKLYPAFIYMVTRVVNNRVEFKTSYSPEGELGYWDRMTPSYTFSIMMTIPSPVYGQHVRMISIDFTIITSRTWSVIGMQKGFSLKRIHR